MEEFNFNGFYTLLLLPVLIGFFRKQISDLIADYMVYRNRKFDDDGDPATGQDCLLQCAATGVFNQVFVKQYRFGFLPASRRVVTIQQSRDRRMVVTYTYSQWRSIVKGKFLK